MQLVSKSDYAQMRGRAPSAVSNWIKDGKLSPPAITDDGLVNVALADAMLAQRLDPSQQLAQERPIGADLDDEDADLLNQATAGATSSNDATKRYLAAKAEAKELEVERQKRNMLADSGRWIETADAARAWTQAFSAFLTDLDAWVNQAGEELATEMGTDLRETTIKLRDKMRAFRERQAKKNAA